MQTPARCCKHLLNNAEQPFRVYHISNAAFVWQVICASSHEETDMQETTWEKLLEQFPQLVELKDIPAEMNVMMQRGKNSGKWYDFHLDMKD